MHFSCTSTIIALGETNLNPNKLNNINIDGFNFVSINEFITHGGVDLYIDKNISFNIQDNLNLLCNKCENVWIKISLLLLSINILVINLKNLAIVQSVSKYLRSFDL